MKLSASGIAQRITEPVIGKLTTAPCPEAARRKDLIPYGSAEALRAFGNDWNGYAGLLCSDGPCELVQASLPAIFAPPDLEYLGDKDVVLLTPSGRVNVLYRRSSEHNTILMTERCNSFCLMCSQPPKTEDDSWRVETILRLLELIDLEAREIGLSGGEPTLLGDDFLRIVSKAEEQLPETSLHVLTNGRQFKNAGFAYRLGLIRHHDMMLGIPLYSDVDRIHDYVVQAKGAYDETLLGFYNLAKANVRLELRVVLHKQTYKRLPQLAEFVARNLPFVEHVALMGLEMFGFTLWNLDALWIDPVEYQSELEAATLCLAERGMNVSIYNHQLCTIPRSIWPFARKSISDWKNVYLDACTSCEVRSFCGGLFQSATKRHSGFIRPQGRLSEAAERFMTSWQ